MSAVKRLMFVVLSLSAAAAFAQGKDREPHIGYLYPGGGQLGTVTYVVAGGQFLTGSEEVYVSGKGVKASVVKYFRTLRNLRAEQRLLFQRRMLEVTEKRVDELPEKFRNRLLPRVKQRREQLEKQEAKLAEKEKAAAEEVKDKLKGKNVKKYEVKMPEHPLLIDLDNKSLRELANIREVFFNYKWRRQFNRQISELVLIKLEIAADAEPGDRELRIRTRVGMTNPVMLQIDALPEVKELEPNDKQAYQEIPQFRGLPTGKPLKLPVMLNGQVMPGDVDRFRFKAKKGQSLVIDVRARKLVPYLADAVPGWFQATVTLYDAKGNEVAFADDYRFNPDPVLFFKVPETGEYEIEIRDSIYRGREDFVYRIAISEQPFITSVFPLGGRQGSNTVAEVTGWNLPSGKLALDTSKGGKAIRTTAMRDGKKLSNSVKYAVDDLPECGENEKNNKPAQAQPVELPIIINGRIEKAGDVDVFKFNGKAGQEIVAEVSARRLNSPLDSLLRLTDASGKIIAANDDYVQMDKYLHKDISGLITHHADSRLAAKLPADGTYYIYLTDVQNHGGKAYGYRLRLGAPQPDFSLRVTPSGLSMRPGSTMPIYVYVMRKDGYDGEIEVKAATPGFKISGGVIPAGCNYVCMTLTSPAKGTGKPQMLRLTGNAVINGKNISRPVVPAEDSMQAFLYRHLVTADNFLTAVGQSKWSIPAVNIANNLPVRIPAGGSAKITINTKMWPKLLNELRLELCSPPKGITLHDLTIKNRNMEFVLKADKACFPKEISGNLLIEVFREYVPTNKQGKPVGKQRRNSMGYLPALPFKIIVPEASGK